jgi:tRNA(Ile)-lysidine synthase
MPDDIAEKLSAIEKGLSVYDNLSASLGSGVEQLRSAIGLLTEQTECINMKGWPSVSDHCHMLIIFHKVDSALKRCILPSPTGTALLSLRGLVHVNDDLTRRSMILRVLRYVSFHPWGSLRADANRRKKSINQIIDKVWGPNPFMATIGRFVAGGGVMWTPVIIQDGRIRMPDKVLWTGIGNDEKVGWLASRQPPMNRHNMEAQELVSPVWVDATQRLVRAFKEWRDGGPPVVQVLYDCRFLIHFDMRKIPEDLVERLMCNDAKIIVGPRTRWYWPKVVEKRKDTTDLLHSRIGDDVHVKSFQVDMGSDDHGMYTVPYRKHEEISSEWIDFEWIRSFSAI